MSTIVRVFAGFVGSLIALLVLLLLLDKGQSGANIGAGLLLALLSLLGLPWSAPNFLLGASPHPAVNVTIALATCGPLLNLLLLYLYSRHRRRGH